MSTHNIVVFAFLFAIIEKIAIFILLSNDSNFYSLHCETMKNNNQSSFIFSFKDWKAEMKTFQNPFRGSESLAIALVYNTKSGYEKTAIYTGQEASPEKIATVFDLLSCSISAQQIKTALDGFDFTTENDRGELVQRTQAPLFSRLKKIK